LANQKVIEKQIGRYQLLEEIGRGGMGIVYKAFEPTLKRTVALKVLAPHLAGQPGLLSRLRREAVSAANLRHNHIALLFEFNQQEENAYLAMEYVPGPSLKQLLEQGPLAPPRCLEILSQIASALDYAHALGIVHRDVKPSNILVGPEDQAMLVDFGLAEMTGSSEITPDGVVLGTPDYMSPEQAAGRAASFQSDQYALAALAYELFTGQPPFHTNSAAATVHAHIYELAPPPTEINPTLPIQVNPIFSRALSKAPEERFESVSAFVAALQKVLLPSPPPEPEARWKTRLLPWVTTTALLLLALVILLAQTGTFSRLFDQGQKRLVLPKNAAWGFDPGFVGGTGLVSVNRVLLLSSPNGQLTALSENDGAMLWQTRLNDLIYGAPAANSELVFVGDQLERIEGLSLRSGGTVWSTKITGKVEIAPVVLEDKLVAITSKGYIYVLNAGNGRVLWSRPFVSGLLAVNATPGCLIVNSSQSVYMLNANSGLLTWEFQTASAITTRPVISNGQVLVSTQQGLLHIINLADGAEQWRYQGQGTLQAAPAVVGQIIYIPDESGLLTAIDLNAKQILWQYKANASLESTPLFVDQHLILGANNGKVIILNAADGHPVDEIQLQTSIKTNPVLGEDLVFIKAERIYAFKPYQPPR
jgi:outer membrane protein assembly factor BamB/predicted Ser/Thr protein kinase